MRDLDINFERLELDAEKAVLVTGLATVLLGLVIAGSIGLEAGTVVQAVLSTTSVSSNWAGVSGEVTEVQEQTAMPVDFFFVDDSRTGSVHTVDLDGKVDGSHFFAALPFHTDNFEREKLESISLSDLEAGGLFSQEDFPIFYPNASSYDSVNDNPENTFEETETIRVLNRELEAAKTEFNGGLEYYLLAYDTGDGTQPLFINHIDEYGECYDGNECNYQFMLPQIDDDYSFYQLSENNPVDVTVLIDGEETTSFPFTGRPYNLTVQTVAIFQDFEPAETEIRVTETEGNNIFTPAISGDYSSDAQTITETDEGEASLMYSPTEYNSPENYNLSVDVYNDGEAFQSVPLSVENDNIEFTDAGPVEKGFDEFENEYRRGVDRLRPIANCMFSQVNSEEAYRLEATVNESYEVVRGVPYVVDVDEASFFSLEERGSHLVMSPGRIEDSIHLESGGSPYSASDSVVFTPTLSSNEDDDLSVSLLDSQGDLLGETNLSVRDATCGEVTDGDLVEPPELTDFKRRVNNIRPVLNSLFVAGS